MTAEEPSIPQAEPSSPMSPSGQTEDDGLRSHPPDPHSESFRAPGNYAKANTSSVLHEYANSEQDHIRNAFTPGSGVRIQDLPDQLKHGQLIRRKTLDRLGRLGTPRMNNVTSNLKTETASTRGIMPKPGSPEGTPIYLPPPSPRNFVGGQPPSFCIPQQTKPPLSSRSFGEYAYQESAYDVADQEKKKSRRKSLEATQSISRRPFLPSCDNQLARHERFQEYLPEPYVAPVDYVTREKKPLVRGPFIPGIAKKALSKGIGPKKLGLILTCLRKELEADWRLTTFTLHGSPKEPVTISFKLSTVESEASLIQYMSNMAKCNTIINENLFLKIHASWAYKPGDGYIHFCFKPPWWSPPRAKHSMSYGSPAFKKKQTL